MEIIINFKDTTIYESIVLSNKGETILKIELVDKSNNDIFEDLYELIIKQVFILGNKIKVTTDSDKVEVDYSSTNLEKLLADINAFVENHNDILKIKEQIA